MYFDILSTCLRNRFCLGHMVVVVKCQDNRLTPQAKVSHNGARIVAAQKVTPVLDPALREHEQWHAINVCHLWTKGACIDKCTRDLLLENSDPATINGHDVFFFSLAVTNQTAGF